MISENRIDSEAPNVSISSESTIEQEQRRSNISPSSPKVGAGNGSTKFPSENGVKSIPSDKERSNVAKIWRDALKPKDKSYVEPTKIVVEEPKFTEVPKSPSMEREKSNISKIWTNALKTKEGKASETVDKPDVDDTEKLTESTKSIDSSKDCQTTLNVELNEKSVFPSAPITNADIIQISEENKSEGDASKVSRQDSETLKSDGKNLLAKVASVELKSSPVPSMEVKKEEPKIKSTTDVPVFKFEEQERTNSLPAVKVASVELKSSPVPSMEVKKEEPKIKSTTDVPVFKFEEHAQERANSLSAVKVARVEVKSSPVPSMEVKKEEPKIKSTDVPVFKFEEQERTNSLPAVKVASVELKSSPVPSMEVKKEEPKIKSTDVPVFKFEEHAQERTNSLPAVNVPGLISPMQVKESPKVKYEKNENYRASESSKTDIVHQSQETSGSITISPNKVDNTAYAAISREMLSVSEEKPDRKEEILPKNNDNFCDFLESSQPVIITSINEKSEFEVKFIDVKLTEESDSHSIEDYRGEQLIFPDSDDVPSNTPVNDGNMIVASEYVRKKSPKAPVYPRPVSPRQKKPVQSPKSVLKDDYTVKPSLPVKTASDRLLKTTAARINDQHLLESRKKDKEAIVVSPKKKVDSYIPSPRLLATTQARVADVKEWETHKEKAKYEQDIWWEARKPAVGAKNDPSTPSKLYESTSACDNSKRDKHVAIKNDNPPSTPPTDLVKINVKSPLLKPTRAVLYNAWKVDPPKQEQHVLVLESQASGPSVQSKFNQDTAASQHARWKSREQKEKEEIQTRPVSPTGKKVSEVSPRLLDLNANLKAAARSKARKLDEDPRECGWKTSLAKSAIPEVDFSVLPSKRSPIKTANRSPGGTVYSDTSNRSHHSDQRISDHDHEDMNSNVKVME